MYVQAGYHVILILVQETHTYVKHAEIRRNILKNLNHQEIDLCDLCYIMHVWLSMSIGSIQNSRCLLLNNHKLSSNQGSNWNDEVGWNCNTSDLYLEGSCFKSWLNQWLFWGFSRFSLALLVKFLDTTSNCYKFDTYHPISTNKQTRNQID
jgi:hypothetical protein